MVHNYGPGRLVMSLHAEVPSHEDILLSHDRIDCIERELGEKYHALACIHMDPVDFDDPEVSRLRADVIMQMADMDESLSLHDFRVVRGETHTNLIFDLVAPFDCRDSKAVADELARRIHEKDNRLYAVITVEHAYA